VFSWIAKAYNWATGKIDTTIAGWVHDLINGVWGFLHGAFGLVIDAWNYFYTRAKGFAEGVEALASETWTFAKWLLDSFWQEWLRWMRRYLLGPIETAAKWIAHEGATMWHLLTHAADLVDFLWDALVAKIETEAWNTGEKLGEFFLALIAKNLSKFAHLIEDILDAIF